MRLSLIGIAAATTAGAIVSVAAQQPAASQAIEAAVAAPSRSPANTARDKYRHPAETLAFFGVKPGDTVVEIWPSGGWYTEILAPLTRGKGILYAAVPNNGTRGIDALKAKDSALYGPIRVASFPAGAGQAKVPDGTADVVLTFRNVHNWRMGYQRDGQDYAADAFKQMYAMLKKGGTLGIEDHRLPESASAERETNSGYIKVSTVRALAEAAGFEFVGASEVNANKADTADWPNGVWTLPPSLALKDQDRAKYLAIGESDRMTLKFRKP